MQRWKTCWVAIVSFAALIVVTGADRAASQSREQAWETCREKFRPAVADCVRDQVQKAGGTAETYIEGCKQRQAEPFRSCVRSIMARGGSRPAAGFSFDSCFGTCLSRGWTGAECARGCSARAVQLQR
jgi:hypothetical protein